MHRLRPADEKYWMLTGTGSFAGRYFTISLKNMKATEKVKITETLFVIAVKGN